MLLVLIQVPNSGISNDYNNICFHEEFAEVLLLSTHTICFVGEIRNNIKTLF